MKVADLPSLASTPANKDPLFPFRLPGSTAEPLPASMPGAAVRQNAPPPKATAKVAGVTHVSAAPLRMSSSSKPPAAKNPAEGEGQTATTGGAAVTGFRV